jgi:hypothetical protein
MLGIADERDINGRQEDRDAGFYGSRNSEVEETSAAEDPL